MNTSVRQGRTWSRLPTALLDGDHPWGAVVSSPSRYGACRQQLIVYPPGITMQDRRWLRIWRGWFVWGGLGWFVLQVVLLRVTSPWQATAAAVGTTALLGAAAYVMAGDARHRVRTLHAAVLPGCHDPVLVEGQRALRLLSTTLATADARHATGELSTVDYEHVWWMVYDAMAPVSDTPWLR